MINQTLKVALAMLVLCTCKPVSGGPFLTLEIGSVVNNYDSSSCIPNGTADVDFTVNPEVPSSVVVDAVHINCTGGQYIGDSGVVGNVRVGWTTRDYHAFWKVYVSGHGVWQHTSDPRVSDGGLDFVGMGITFKGKKR